MENTAKIIHALKTESELVLSPKSRFSFYDSLLLWIVLKHPLKIEEIFTHLFKKNSTNSILLFLDEKTTLWQDISIFSTLPKMLFIKAMFNSLIEKYFIPKKVQTSSYLRNKRTYSGPEKIKALQIEF
jgi:lycopene beta-cyclase